MIISAKLINGSFGKFSVMKFFIAGDRVVTDLLCKPFSMGRSVLHFLSSNFTFPITCEFEGFKFGLMIALEIET